MKINLTLGAIFGVISQIAPFVLPTLFFESGLLMAVSPLALFLLTLRQGAWIGLVGLMTNTGFLYAIEGAQASLFAAWFWLIIGILLPQMLKRRGLSFSSLAIPYVTGAFLLLAIIFVLAQQTDQGVVEYLKAKIATNVDVLKNYPDSPVQKLINERGRTEVLNQIADELPSGILLIFLGFMWVNLLFVSQLTRGLLAPTFWSGFKLPEWLVWPTLLSGAAFVLGHHAIYYFGLNGMKLFLACYALQGLSILSFILTRFQFQGFFRALAFAFAFLIAMPVVISLGFFDQWFDFRSKFRQS